MTTGSPAKILILFMLPLLLGNIFQQLYNIVDTIIVGNFIGANAMASVGATTPLVFLMIAIAMGLSIGCSILISQYFGAQDFVNLKKAVFNSFVVSLSAGFILTLIGLIVAKPLLLLLNTPSDIFNDAYSYITIFYSGLIFVFMYNALSSITRAIGDSVTPLIFLMLAALLNIVLDYAFVVYLNLGVPGVAWATLISQAVSAILCLFYVYFRIPLLKLKREDMVLDIDMIKHLLRYAIPSTVQQCIVSFSLLAIQGFVNSYGSTFIAGYTAASKIDSVAILPMLNITMAFSTYVAQNIGANKLDRIKAGFRVTMIIIFVMSALISGAVIFYGDVFIGAFLDNATNSDVISIGVSYLQVVSSFYIVMGLMFTAGSVLRGAGDVVFYMTSTLSIFAVRIFFTYFLANFIGSSALWWSIPIGWTIGATINMIRYKSGKWKTKAQIKTRIVESD